MNPQDAYSELIRLSREANLLSSCQQLLEWDAEVCMPRGGVKHRSDQVALLAGLVHDRATDPRIGDLLSVVEGSSLVSHAESTEAVNVRELRREFDRENRMPRRLVEEKARATALASRVWADARRDNDFKSFAPWIERIFALAREEADAVGFAEERYDALLDHYEPGMTARSVSLLFEQLEPQLIPLVDALCGSAGVRRTNGSRREFPRDQQQEFFKEVAQRVGFEAEWGRVDVAEHPFCALIGPGDVRITVHYDLHNFGRGFSGLLHEIGHALYDHGLDAENYGTPMGSAVSLGVHESQSRLWENLVGRSFGFWRYFYPRLQETFHSQLHDVSLDGFRRQINHVERNLIRVGSDEVTYNLHIMVRFDLERALIEGDLAANDLPDAWAELYRRRLGIAPDDDRTGCLQDIHWSEALIGYFPTYTLGNVYAAQIFAAAERAIGPLEEEFARGEFRGLRAWLRENVHRHGQRYRPAVLIERVTGSAPDPIPMIESLRYRYS